MTEADIIARIVKPLVFKNDVRNGLYAEVPIGQGFTGCYSIHDLDALDGALRIGPQADAIDEAVIRDRVKVLERV